VRRTMASTPTTRSTWEQIVLDCRGDYQSSINVGTNKRRQAVVEVDDRLKALTAFAEAFDNWLLSAESFDLRQMVDSYEALLVASKGVKSIMKAGSMNDEKSST